MKKILTISAILISSLFLNSNVWGYTSSELNSANNLAELGIIVDQSANPINYGFDENVLRQEVAAVTNSLACIPKKNYCSKSFLDVTANSPNTWACYSIEALLDKGLIAGNARFRPEANISKAETIGMIVAAVYKDEYQFNANLGTSWQEQIVSFAVSKGITSNFIDYNTPASRGFVFEVAYNSISKSGTSCNLWNNGSGSWINGNTNSGACSGTTIDGYSLYSAKNYERISATKTAYIYLGTRKQYQDFQCNNGKFVMVGSERFGYASCDTGATRDPNEPSMCISNNSNTNRVNGSCGSVASSSPLFSQPTYNLCYNGYASSVTNTGYNWSWTCYGTNGGTNADCQVPRAYCTTQPLYTYAIFTTGTPTSVNQQWVKDGRNGCSYTCVTGYTGNECELSQALPTNGSCGGAVSATPSYTQPSSNLCYLGTPSSVTNTGYNWSWTCYGVNGGANKTCETPRAYCTTQPLYENAIFTTGTPTGMNQQWQKDGTGGCYFTCKQGYTGDTCDIQPR